MSQYHLKAKDPIHTVMFGWDPPMNTFFAHVIDTEKDEDDEGRDVYWVGCHYQEIHDADVLLKGLAPYIDPTREELHQLEFALSVDANWNDETDRFDK